VQYKIDLRGYQHRGKKATSVSFSQGNRTVVFVLGTGGGKTVIFCSMARDAIMQGIPVMVVCNREELIGQCDKTMKRNGLHGTKIVPGYKVQLDNLYIASIDTLVNYPMPEIGLLIIDECHYRDFDELVLWCKERGIYCVGFTATPIRYGKAFLDAYPKYTGQMGDVYDDMIIGASMSELLAGDPDTGESYLVPSIPYGAKIDISEIRVSDTKDGKEFNKADVKKVLNKPQKIAGTVQKYLEKAKGKKFICYCDNVEQSKKQAELFNSMGIPTIHIDGKTKNRKKIFEDFHNGKYMGLCNALVAVAGLDEPTIECIIMDIITMSLAKFIQIYGRGGRPCPEIGKKDFIFLDMGGNVERHGYWEMDRDWSLDTDYVSKTKGVAPVKDCEFCEALIPASATICKYCNNTVAIKEPDKGLNTEAEFVELKIVPDHLKSKSISSLNAVELEEFREAKGHSIGWVVKNVLLRSISPTEQHKLLSEYGTIKRYATGWASKQMQLHEENREEAKAQIWQFIQDNQHVTNDYLSDYSYKKLKATHTEQQIKITIPKIIEAAENFRTLNVPK